MKLNENQREAVYHVHGPLMILAGAGSGKTGVITQKIAHLIRDQGVKALRILGVTFTNKAANEMKERLKLLLGKKSLRGITISTFHAFCVKLLRIEGERIGFQAKFSIYGEGDQLALIKQILVDFGKTQEEVDPKIVAMVISKAKNQLLLPEHLKGNASLMGLSGIYVDIYDVYQKRLKAHQAMDFDDLILYTVYLLQLNEDIKEKYVKRFRFVLVDEFQDTNYAQFELLKLLTHSDSNITVVGDDDQSIYSWRGAEASNFHRYEEEFNSVKVVILDQNYRSTTNILRAAGAIISQNQNRKAKSLWSENGLGDKVTYYECETEEDESFRVADLLFEKKMKSKVSYHNFAILYRTNFQSRPFETALRIRNIPYRVIGGTSFYDRKEIKDLVAYLKLINNQDDDVSLLRIINYPRRGIGESTIESLREFAQQHSLSLFQAMEAAQRIETLDLKAQARAMEFTHLMNQFIDEFDSNSLSQTMLRLIEFMDYESEIFKVCKDETEWNRKLTNIRDFVRMIENYESGKNEDGLGDKFNPTLKGFLNQVSLLYDIPDQKDDDIEENKVTLLTLHSAKGLEFPYVFMVGMEEGIIPHGNNENLDEERRLCYVGFTRAMKSLFLTSCKTRRKYGVIETQMPSRFLDEIPPDLLNFKALDDEEELAHDDAVDYFSEMKKMLAD